MIRLELVTLSGVKASDEVYEVLLPTLDGQIGVLPGHMPLVSVATTGVVSVRRRSNDPDDLMEHFAVSGGVIEVDNNVLRILVDEADAADDINEAEVQAAYDRAQKLKEQATDQVSLDHAQSLVDRQAVRLQVANLRRRRTHS